MRQTILEKVHKAKYTIHPRAIKMYKDLRDLNWWPGMKKSVTRYVAQCDTCQRIKAEHQKLTGKLQPLEIPEWKWEHVTMDFVIRLQKMPTRKDAIWVIVDRLTKSAHFFPMKVGQPISKLAQLYIKEIVRLHGTLVSIVSNKDPRFTSRFWEGFQ